MPSLSSGGGACRKGLVDLFRLLVVNWRKWVAVRWVVRTRLVDRVEARRLVQHGGGSGAVVMVMRLVGDSGLG